MVSEEACELQLFGLSWSCNFHLHCLFLCGNFFDDCYFWWTGHFNGSELLVELQGQHNILKECIAQMKSAESSIATLVSNLREALQEQVQFLRKCYKSITFENIFLVNWILMEFWYSGIKARTTSRTTSGNLFRLFLC